MLLSDLCLSEELILQVENVQHSQVSAAFELSSCLKALWNKIKFKLVPKR